MARDPSPGSDPGPVDHRRALALLERWTAAGSVDRLRAEVVDGVAAWTGCAVTLFRGGPPDGAPQVHDPVATGQPAARLDQYRERFAAADVFAGERARRRLRAAGVVTLDELRRASLPPVERHYVADFLDRNGLHHQLTLWLDTGGPEHAYLSVLSPATLPPQVRATLTLVRPHLGHLLRQRPAPAPAAGWAGLTRREREIADLVAAAHGNRAIARRLGITEDTVKRHLTHVFAKTGAVSRARLALAWRDGTTT